jgi:hypothetical protein
MPTAFNPSMSRTSPSVTNAVTPFVFIIPTITSPATLAS